MSREGLQKQVRLIKFLGLDNKTDPKSASIGKMDAVENAFATRRTDVMGGFEYRKRFGLTSYNQTVAFSNPFASIAAGTDLAQFQDELILLDGIYFYTYGGPVAANWLAKGYSSQIAAFQSVIDSGLGSSVSPVVKPCVDVASNGGITVIVQYQKNASAIAPTVYVYDNTTGGLLHWFTTSTVFRAIKLATVGSQIDLFGWDGTNTLKNVRILTATPETNSAEVNVVANVNASGIFDVCTDFANGRYNIVYHNTTPGTTLAIWNTNQTIGATNPIVSTICDKCVGFLHWDQSNGFGYVAAGTSSANGVRAFTYSVTTLAVTAEVNVDAAVTTAANVTGWFNLTSQRVVFYEVPNATTYNTIVKAWYNGTGTNFARSVGLASKIYKVITGADSTGRYYLNVAYESTLQRHLLTMEIMPSGPTGSGQQHYCAYLMNSNCAGLTGATGCLPNVAYVSATNVFSVYVACDNAAAPTYYNIVQFNLTWDRSLLGPPVEFNGALHFPGACQMAYDGLNASEDGFFSFPEAPTGVQGATGSLTTSGVYQWLVVYKFTDRNGRVLRSFPGKVLAVTLTVGNNTMTLTLPSLRITNKSAWTSFHGGAGNFAPIVRLEVYRTKTLESNFYKVGEALNPDISSIDTISFTDNFSDTAIGANELLYTTGGTVGNVMPPCSLQVVTWRNRLFTLSGDTRIWHTKDKVTGNHAEYGDAMRIEPDVRDGVFTAMSPMDTSLVLFKRSSVYLLLGDGPSLNGANPYQSPIALTSKEGSIGPRVLASTPDGIIFKSAKGWRLCARSFDIVPMEGAENYDSLTITGSAVLDDRAYACFTSSNGTTLIWDWQFKTWYAWLGQAATACCRYETQFHIMTSAGLVKKEVFGQWADDGVGYQVKCETSWLNIAELFGSSRLYSVELIGDVMSTTTLSATLQYDYDTAIADAAKTLAVTTATKGSLMIRPGQRRSQAVKFIITSTDTGESFRLSAIALEVGYKPGTRKQPLSKQFT